MIALKDYGTFQQSIGLTNYSGTCLITAKQTIQAQNGELTASENRLYIHIFITIGSTNFIAWILLNHAVPAQSPAALMTLPGSYTLHALPTTSSADGKLVAHLGVR